jgi:hypothetical protein
MQILSTRSKVSSRRFYESFTSNKRCNLYIRDNRKQGRIVVQGINKESRDIILHSRQH